MSFNPNANIIHENLAICSNIMYFFSRRALRNFRDFSNETNKNLMHLFLEKFTSYRRDLFIYFYLLKYATEIFILEIFIIIFFPLRL